MEKELGKISKNPETEIVVRIDDFGGKRGLTIREFVTSERYTGFTKAGVRITPENFEKFKEMINSVEKSDLQSETTEQKILSEEPKEKKDDHSGMDEKGLM